MVMPYHLVCMAQGHWIASCTLLALFSVMAFTIQYGDISIGAMASQSTGVSIVYSTVCSGADQRKHQSSVVNSPHKGSVTRKMFPFVDVIMIGTKPSPHSLAHIANGMREKNFKESQCSSKINDHVSRRAVILLVSIALYIVHYLNNKLTNTSEST